MCATRPSPSLWAPSSRTPSWTHTVLGWFLDLKEKAAGRYTLLAGLNCFKFLGHVFQFEENISDCAVLKRAASDWEAEAPRGAAAREGLHPPVPHLDGAGREGRGQAARGPHVRPPAPRHRRPGEER